MKNVILQLDDLYSNFGWLLDLPYWGRVYIRNGKNGDNKIMTNIVNMPLLLCNKCENQTFLLAVVPAFSFNYSEIFFFIDLVINITWCWLIENKLTLKWLVMLRFQFFKTDQLIYFQQLI